MRFFHLVSILALLTGCSGSYMGKDVCSADEFVMDSYKIRQGKFAILEMEGKSYGELPEDALEEYPDKIGDDDILQIALYHPKRTDVVQAVQSIGMQVGYHVKDGMIHLPDLGPVCVGGLSLREAADKIQERYREEIEDMEVFVTYKQRIVGKVEMIGSTSIPNIPVDGKMRLFDLLAKARVPAEANFFKSYLLRDNKMLPVDFYKLIKEGDMTQNIVMRPGDKIYIADPGSSTLMIMGEVNCECVLPLPHGYMPLRQALASAKGIPYSGDKSYIQIIRGSIVKPKIYVVSWDHVMHLPNDSLLLIPGDIVYVAAKPLAEWNRFISQLLPLFSQAEVVQKGCGQMGLIP